MTQETNKHIIFYSRQEHEIELDEKLWVAQTQMTLFNQLPTVFSGLDKPKKISCKSFDCR